jgi:hypothetical protein
MAKHTIKGHIFWQMTKYLKEPHIGFIEYDIRQWRTEDLDGRVHIAEHSFEVDVPDNFDPRPGMLANLEAEKQQVRAEFARRITELDRQISQLMAIENAS